MVETITACENVCRDFSWLSPLIAAAANLAVIFGVVIALQQLGLSRREAAFRRKRELAEDMLVAASQVEDAFRYIRSPLSSIPADKVGDRAFIFQKRNQRLVDQETAFSRLREMQVRCEAIMGRIGLQEHVTELIALRTEIALAIEDMIDGKISESWSASDTENGVLKQARRKLSGSWSERDAFGQKILSEIAAIRFLVRKHACLNRIN